MKYTRVSTTSYNSDTCATHRSRLPELKSALILSTTLAFVLLPPNTFASPVFAGASGPGAGLAPLAPVAAAVKPDAAAPSGERTTMRYSGPIAVRSSSAPGLALPGGSGSVGVALSGEVEALSRACEEEVLDAPGRRAGRDWMLDSQVRRSLRTVVRYASLSCGASSGVS